jgi:hypothetical protein
MGRIGQAAQQLSFTWEQSVATHLAVWKTLRVSRACPGTEW